MRNISLNDFIEVVAVFGIAFSGLGIISHLVPPGLLTYSDPWEILSFILFTILFGLILGLSRQQKKCLKNEQDT